MIEEVSASPTSDIPSGGAHVDLRGKTVMPTIVDPHGHIGYLRGGVTSKENYSRANVVRSPPSTGAFFAPDAIHEVSTIDEAREAVRALSKKNPDAIKFWVNDHGGAKEKLSPELYTAIIHEAHDLGHMAIARIFELDDAKGVVRAEVDGLAHMVHKPARRTHRDARRARRLRFHVDEYPKRDAGRLLARCTLRHRNHL